MLNSPSHRSSDINDAPLSFWSARGYTDEDVIKLGESINSESMGALVTFTGQGAFDFAISQRTWDRQEGHYPAIARYLREVAQHPLLAGRTGKIFIWLEDGLWEHQQHYSWRAPTLCFGRHIYDNHSLLMPDPAYIDSEGYVKEIAEIREAERGIDYSKKHRTMFFRGAATGLGIEGPDWVKTARGRICLKSVEFNNPAMLDAKLTRLSHLSGEHQNVMGRAGVVGEVVPFNDFLRYLYLIHADGYCCAWKSLPTKLAASSVTVRIMSDYEQWYYREMVPWKHYVPLKPDLSDLTLVYEWMERNPLGVRTIIDEANGFVQERLAYRRNLDDMAELVSSILSCRKS